MFRSFLKPRHMLAYVDLSLSLSHRRSGEAISSEPPSLACPIQKAWRARVAEREGVHLPGEPERADLIRHWA